jgi:hypothetical protein
MLQGDTLGTRHRERQRAFASRDHTDAHGGIPRQFTVQTGMMGES